MIIIFIVLASCTTSCATKPLTWNLINEAGGSTEVEKFQYFVSTKLQLSEKSKQKDQNVNAFGTATITENTYVNRVIISKNTKGAALSSYTDEKGILTLEVCFENDDNNRIKFRQDGPGSDNRFFLVFENQFNRTIKYGDETYTVDFAGDRPYLIMKMYKQSREKLRVRWAPGRSVKN